MWKHTNHMVNTLLIHGFQVLILFNSVVTFHHHKARFKLFMLDIVDVYQGVPVLKIT